MPHAKPSHRTVRDVMTKDVVAVGPDATATEIARTMADANVGTVLVTEQSRLQGLITDRKLVIQVLALGKSGADVLAHQIMTRNPLSVRPDSPEEDAVHLMGEHQVRRLPVVENNEVVGIISIADLAKDLIGCPDCEADLAKELAKAT